MTARAFLLVLALACASPAWGAPALPDTVRVTASGSAYHRLTCASVRDRVTVLVRRSAADSVGYKPCKRCIAPAPKTRKPSRFDRLTGGAR